MAFVNRSGAFRKIRNRALWWLRRKHVAFTGFQPSDCGLQNVPIKGHFYFAILELVFKTIGFIVTFSCIYNFVFFSYIHLLMASLFICSQFDINKPHFLVFSPQVM